jgi:phosphoglycolate phosphatase-like HAD superfamily hydrolase
VIFDFDGTLVDTMDAFADIAARVIHERYGAGRDEARRDYLRTSGLPFRQQLELLYPGDSRNDDAAREFEDTKVEGFFAETFPDDTREAVNSLRDNGYLVVVSSNNFQDLVDRFVARDSGIRFHMVLGARDNFYKGTDHFNHVLKTFGLSSSEMLFVGDSLKDAEKAVDHKVRFVGKLGTFAREDFEKSYPGVETVSRLPQLLDILR